MNLLLSNWGENFVKTAPDGLLVFVLGMLVIFLGMTIIVAIISAIGAIMKKTTEAKKNKPVTLPAKEEIPVVVTENEVDDKVKAAIIAAIAAYYFDNESGCEFKVKRIKRI